jgi:hypothetical protein
VFLPEDGDRIEPHEYQLSFRPFTPGELRARLEPAGSREVDTDYGEAVGPLRHNRDGGLTGSQT